MRNSLLQFCASSALTFTCVCGAATSSKVSANVVRTRWCTCSLFTLSAKLGYSMGISRSDGRGAGMSFQTRGWPGTLRGTSTPGARFGSTS